MQERIKKKLNSQHIFLLSPPPYFFHFSQQPDCLLKLFVATVFHAALVIFLLLWFLRALLNWCRGWWACDIEILDYKLQSCWLQTMRLFPLSSSSSTSSEKEQSNGGSSRVMLYLNIYDLTPINNYLYWFGLGIFHSGIEGNLLIFNGW
jgi:hypothetical protein